MAKEEKRACPHRCPLCALYEAQEALQEAIKDCLPPEVSAHANRAVRELFLAVRALLDKGLEGLNREPKPGSRRKIQKVRVE